MKCDICGKEYSLIRDDGLQRCAYCQERAESQEWKQYINDIILLIAEADQADLSRSQS